MKKLLFSAPLRLCVFTLLSVATLQAADEVKRDANGKIISTATKSPGGSETVRDPNGKIIEQKNTTPGQNTTTTTVRDAQGKIIRTETRR